mmetsp:Transcript_27986/g.68020  ORF Transcript_27986/g.68020 Transcript_27986/m.68020 type:complete len:252 (-) Transcript_27986:114-869(-)
MNPFLQRPPAHLRRLLALSIDIFVYLALPSAFLDELGENYQTLSFLLDYDISPISFLLRDVISHRSLGKRILGLEIVQVERRICPENGVTYRTTEIPATRGMAVLRGLDFLPRMDMIIGANIALVLLSPTRRSLGDHLSGSMVVPEGPHYNRRVERMREEFPQWQPRAQLASHVEEGDEDHPLNIEKMRKLDTGKRKVAKPTAYPSLLLVCAGATIGFLLDQYVDVTIDVEFVDGDEDDDDNDEDGGTTII